MSKRTPEERTARKTAAGLKVVPGPSAELLAMTVEQLNALSDDLDRQRGEIMAKKRAVHAARCYLLATDHAAEHGLTPEGYAEAKRIAREQGTPLQQVLKSARKLQVARAQAASVGVKAKGT